MLKQCALAFAQTKPTEWDYFRQEWLEKMTITIAKIEPTAFNVETADNSASIEPRIVPYESEPIEPLPEQKEEPKPHRSRALKKDEE